MTQTAGVVVVSTLFGEKYELPFAAVVAFVFCIVHALLMPFKYKSLDFLQLLVLGGQAITYFLLLCMENGIGDRGGIDVSLFVIQIVFFAAFATLLTVYLLPGFKQNTLPALTTALSGRQAVNVAAAMNGAAEPDGGVAAKDEGRNGDAAAAVEEGRGGEETEPKRGSCVLQ